jgi:hypothetical protein
MSKLNPNNPYLNSKPPSKLSLVLIIASVFVMLFWFSRAFGSLTFDVCGDCDFDGTITISDLVTCVNNAISGIEPGACGDCNNDGQVSIDELIGIVDFSLNNSIFVANGAANAAPTPTPVGNVRDTGYDSSPFIRGMYIHVIEMDGTTHDETFDTIAHPEFQAKALQPVRRQIINPTPTPQPPQMNSTIESQQIIADDIFLSTWPTPTDINWTDIKQILIGEQWEIDRPDVDYYFPNGTNTQHPLWIDWVNIVRQQMQFIARIYLRDEHVDLKVDRLVLNMGKIMSIDEVKTNWPWPGSGRVMQIGQNIFNPHDNVGTACPGNVNFGVATTTYEVMPNYPQFASDMLTIAHELGHGVMRGAHTQCIILPDGTNLQKCQDTSCWTMDTVCPPTADFDIMSYCWYCYGFPPYPTMQFGPPFGTSAFLNREHVVSETCYRTSGYLPRTLIGETLDTDGDGWPDYMDNCPNKYNPNQTDSKMSGYGDACSGCNVVPTRGSGAAWQLLFPLIIFLWRRK